MRCRMVSCNHHNPSEKEVTSSRHRFPKPVEQYKVLLFFGANIVASEGEEWKKFRKITAPAFSDVRPVWYNSDILLLTFSIQRNNRLVWDETSLIMLDLFDNVWIDQDEIVVDHCVDITLQVFLYLSVGYYSVLIELKIALSVISVAGTMVDHTSAWITGVHFFPTQDLVVECPGWKIKSFPRVTEWRSKSRCTSFQPMCGSGYWSRVGQWGSPSEREMYALHLRNSRYDASSLCNNEVHTYLLEIYVWSYSRS